MASSVPRNEVLSVKSRLERLSNQEHGFDREQSLCRCLETLGRIVHSEISRGKIADVFPDTWESSPPTATKIAYEDGSLSENSVNEGRLTEHTLEFWDTYFVYYAACDLNLHPNQLAPYSKGRWFTRLISTIEANPCASIDTQIDCVLAPPLFKKRHASTAVPPSDRNASQAARRRTLKTQKKRRGRSLSRIAASSSSAKHQSSLTPPDSTLWQEVIEIAIYICEFRLWDQKSSLTPMEIRIIRAIGDMTLAPKDKNAREPATRSKIAELLNTTGDNGYFKETIRILIDKGLIYSSSASRNSSGYKLSEDGSRLFWALTKGP